MKVLSLFDGMACGAIAFTELGIPIERYVAYEIDKYAIKAATHNFPFIEEKGDVFNADFTEYKGFDWLIGGSPCTYWSIAQKNNRETEASGMGWDLFCQYVRAVKEAQPKYFLYENNKSMSNDIRQSITDTFGFEPICINSALVSAQNRQRLYWVGIRQADGTYRKANIEQPADRGILLKDILENRCVKEDKDYCQKHHTNIKFEPMRIPPYGDDTKSRPIEALYANHAGTGEGSLEKRLCSDNPNKQQNDLIAEPVCLNPKDAKGKQPSLSSRIYDVNAKGTAVTTGWTTKIPELVEYEPRNNSHVVINENAIRCSRDKNNASCAESFVEFTDKKAQTVTTAHKPKIIQELCKCWFAKPIEWNGDIPIKAISQADGKTYTVYEVKDGQITIKDKQYPIKLKDGYYIIRKLTVLECMRLQTVPEWYEFPVSNSQAYKMLGNGWTCAVIEWLIGSTLNNGE